MQTKVVQIRGRGTVTLPAKIRERYALADGDPMTLVDLDGAIVLVPKVGIVPKLVEEIEQLRKEAGLSMEELIAGVREERARYYTEQVGKHR